MVLKTEKINPTCTGSRNNLLAIYKSGFQSLSFIFRTIHYPSATPATIPSTYDMFFGTLKQRDEGTAGDKACFPGIKAVVNM